MNDKGLKGLHVLKAVDQVDYATKKHMSLCICSLVNKNHQTLKVDPMFMIVATVIVVFLVRFGCCCFCTCYCCNVVYILCVFFVVVIVVVFVVVFIFSICREH